MIKQTQGQDIERERMTQRRVGLMASFCGPFDMAFANLKTSNPQGFDGCTLDPTVYNLKNVEWRARDNISGWTSTDCVRSYGPIKVHTAQAGNRKVSLGWVADYKSKERIYLDRRSFYPEILGDPEKINLAILKAIGARHLIGAEDRYGGETKDCKNELDLRKRTIRIPYSFDQKYYQTVMESQISHLWHGRGSGEIITPPKEPIITYDTLWGFEVKENTRGRFRADFRKLEEKAYETYLELIQ
jgi:hypothetical protein